MTTRLVARRLLVTAGLFAACGAALVWVSFFAALAEGAASKASVKAVLDFHQVEKILARAVPDIEAAMAKRKKEVTVPASHEKRVLELARRIYPARNLYKTLQVAYTKAITLENLESHYKWQTGPKGIKMRRALEDGWAVGPADHLKYVNGEGTIVLKANRKNALESFVREWQLDLVGATVKGGADFAVFVGLNASVPIDNRDSRTYLKDKIDPRITGYRPEVGVGFGNLSAYAFREMKNAEIDDFVSYGTTSVAQAHTKALIKAIGSTMDAAASTLEQQVIKASKPSP
jgi:hypothetical protein